MKYLFVKDWNSLNSEEEEERRDREIRPKEGSCIVVDCNVTNSVRALSYCLHSRYSRP